MNIDIPGESWKHFTFLPILQTLIVYLNRYLKLFLIYFLLLIIPSLSKKVIVKQHYLESYDLLLNNVPYQY